MKYLSKLLALEKTLDWAYSKALEGTYGIDSAIELANTYTYSSGNINAKVNRLIRWQNAKAATSGFVTGLGGLITLPISIPANFASVMYVQIRMIAAIAHMGGHNLRDDRIKTMIYVCLLGNAASEILKDIGIIAGKKITHQLIRKISDTSIKSINQALGFKLIAKFGSKGVIKLSKFIPIAGGVIGGTFDTVSTNIIGNMARNTFI